ncbi:MAG TPA: hypothetical protein VGD37_04915, partial [Kofleriaceae bacterium]
VSAPPAPTRVAPPQRPVAPPARPLTAAHGSDIVALGATADGLAVASANRLGGIRLWPALDGTREPVVIRGTAARSIILMRDGDGFAIGTLDAAGGVHVIRTGADGVVRGRATVAGEQPVTEIAGTAAGVLVLRADQAIELVDPGGAVRARLTPEPGTRVDSLVARGGRVLARVQEDKQIHGRWLALDHGLADLPGARGAARDRPRGPRLRAPRRRPGRRRGVRARPRDRAAARGRGADPAAERRRRTGRGVPEPAAGDADRRRAGPLGHRAVERRGARLDLDGELVVQFPSGIARLDLETGQLAERHCGWSFGLSEQPFEAGHTGPSICDAER